MALTSTKVQPLCVLALALLFSRAVSFGNQDTTRVCFDDPFGLVAELGTGTTCAGGKRQGNCASHSEMMRKYCSKTCQFCGAVAVAKPCLDNEKLLISTMGSAVTCAVGQGHGYCTSHAPMMKQCCAKTCGLCSTALGGGSAGGATKIPARRPIARPTRRPTALPTPWPTALPTPWPTARPVGGGSAGGAAPKPDVASRGTSGCPGNTVIGQSIDANHGYTANAKCGWYITCPGCANCKVKAHFTLLNTESGYDFVTMNDGGGWPASGTQLARTSGSSAPADVSSSGSAMTVTLTSDHSDQKTGFKMGFQCTQPSGGSAHPCSSAPCKNGGACVQVAAHRIRRSAQAGSMFRCTCAAGYGGATCEQGQLDYPVYHGAAAGGGGTKRGHPFTLYKLPAATGFTKDLSGATKYIDLCTAAGLHPIGCGTSYDCDASRVGGAECIPMPAAWYCNMERGLHGATAWEDLVTLLSAHSDRDYPVSWYRGAYHSSSMSAAWALHPVCGKMDS